MDREQMFRTHGEAPTCELCKAQLHWSAAADDFVDGFDSLTCSFFDHLDDHQPSTD